MQDPEPSFAVIRDRVRAAVFERRVDLAAMLLARECEAEPGFVPFSAVCRIVTRGLRVALSELEVELLRTMP